MSHSPVVESLIKKFDLELHPEGGYYRSTYRSAEKVPVSALPSRFPGDRLFSTAIYFLLDKGNYSAFHRIKSDECWHFYTGGTLLIYVLHPDGALQVVRLGNDYENHEHFQFVVPAGCWFASEPAPVTEFSFVGCTVSPGFDFDDFELASSTGLSAEFPLHKELIERLCR